MGIAVVKRNSTVTALNMTLSLFEARQKCFTFPKRKGMTLLTSTTHFSVISDWSGNEFILEQKEEKQVKIISDGSGLDLL